MPLPWRKKIGIKYCYHPILTPQLGVFTNVPFDAYELLFIQVDKFTKYGDFFFNYANNVSVPVIKRDNYIINLSKNYDTLRSDYNAALINNLKKATAFNLIYGEEENPGLAIDLYKEYYKTRTAHLNENDYERAKVLCAFLYKNKMAFIRKVTNEQNEILALSFLLYDEKRLYNIVNIITPEGREKNANHVLMDNIIKEFAEQNLIFDLEGSEIPGVKFFYKKFGSVNQPYSFYHLNKLPALLKILKK